MKAGNIILLWLWTFPTQQVAGPQFDSLTYMQNCYQRTKGILRNMWKSVWRRHLCAWSRLLRQGVCIIPVLVGMRSVCVFTSKFKLGQGVRQGCSGTHRRNCKCAVPEGHWALCSAWALCMCLQWTPTWTSRQAGAVKVKGSKQGAETTEELWWCLKNPQIVVCLWTQRVGVCVCPWLTSSLCKLKRKGRLAPCVCAVFESSVQQHVWSAMPVCLCVFVFLSLWHEFCLLLVEAAAGKAAAASLSMREILNSSWALAWAPAAEHRKTELDQLEQEITFLMSLYSVMTTPVDMTFLH